MSEEVKNDTSELAEQTEQQVNVPNPFAAESWATPPVNTEESTTKVEATQPVVEATQKTEEEEILDPKEWLKREFDTDDISVLKAEREEYKKLKETNPSEIKFADEQSKQIHELIREGKRKEVRQFLETQDKLETLISQEVSKETAADIIKLSMQLKHKDLTPQEIDYKFNKQFGIPKEPTELATETEDEFKERHDQWKELVADVEMNRIIEAKTAKPDLEKAKAELVLPEIQQKENQGARKEPTQEELAAFESAKNSFLQSAEKSISSFNGFTSQVKDKDVDYTVSYAPSQEEKTTISNKIKEFAETGFDANSILAERWVEEDGKTIKIDQMVKDLSRIYGDDRVSQKLVSDAANKRLEAYLKDKKQIDVSGVDQNGKLQLEKDNKTEAAQLQEFFWSQD